MKYFNDMMWSIYQNTGGHRQMDLKPCPRFYSINQCIYF